MNYEVSEKKGENLTVGLSELGEGQYEITLEGEKIHVDAVKSGRTIYSIIEAGRQYEAMVDERGAHGFDVLVSGRLFHLEAIDERSRLLTATVHAAEAGKQTVEAEMPGKVVRLCVSVGERVCEGQGVVIVEAMKMENEIASPIEGVVTEIAVAEDQTVEAGTRLFVVEPEETQK